MKTVAAGILSSIFGSILWIWPSFINTTWSYDNPAWAFVLSMLGLVSILASCYLFGRKLGGVGLVMSLIPTAIVSGTEASVIAARGYQGTGGGAMALFLEPFFFLFVSMASSSVGIAMKHRASKKA